MLIIEDNVAAISYIKEYLITQIADQERAIEYTIETKVFESPEAILNYMNTQLYIAERALYLILQHEEQMRECK